MKGVQLLRQLEATGVASVRRLLSSARPTSMSRGMSSTGSSKTENEDMERLSGSASSREAMANAMPGPSKHMWWRPDPLTGAWVPEGCEGQVATSTDVLKFPSRTSRVRTESTASLEDKRWWASMEELPDMDPQ